MQTPTFSFYTLTAWRGFFALALCALPATLSSAAAEPKPKAEDEDPIAWISGPSVARLGSRAEVKVPEGYQFANGDDTRLLLKAGGNPVSGSELGLMAPTNANWFVVFEFSDSGYVKDDEKNELDADKMLASITKGNDYANKERQDMGFPPLKIVGWEQKPTYDPETHNLEWAIRAESEGRPVINYNTRLLGRKGVMEIALVVNPEELPGTLPTFKSLLKDYSFSSGERYAEYKEGDRLAQYGLAALVTGGAAVVAAKTGLLGGLLLFFKKGWKLVVAAVVGLVALAKRVIFGKQQAS